MTGVIDTTTGAGGVDDYTTTAAATLIVGGVAIGKSLVSPQARYAIGDPVRYRVDRCLGAAQWPAVRFLARVDAARITQLTVTADVAYERGHPLAATLSAPVPIMLLL